MADRSSSTYESEKPFVRLFFRTKLRLALGLANLKKGELILDFGCGEGWIKNFLKRKGYNVVGYDITPEHTDIKDYGKLKPDKILAFDVFEHIPKEEIIKIIKNFKKMNSSLELITIIPTENLVSRKIRKFLGKSERVQDHITTMKELLRILRQEMKEIKRMNFLSVSYIGKFKF